MNKTAANLIWQNAFVSNFLLGKKKRKIHGIVSHKLDSLSLVPVSKTVRIFHNHPISLRWERQESHSIAHS